MKGGKPQLTTSIIDPPVAHAGEREQWTVRLAGPALPAGARIKLVFSDVRGKPADWGGLQIEDPHSEGYVSARGPDGVGLHLSIPDWDETGQTAVLVTVGEPGIEEVAAVEIVLGDVSGHGHGLRAQTFTQRCKAIVILFDFGDGRWQEAQPAPTLAVEGGTADRVQIVAPSTVRPGEKFDALLRAEDHHGNRAGFYQGLIGLRAEGIRGAAAKRLLPEEVAVTPRDASLLTIRGTAPQSGDLSFRIRAEDLRSGDKYMSNPVVVLGEEDPHNLYWGVLGGHTDLTDGVGAPEEFFACLRNDNRLDFGALGDVIDGDTEEAWRRATEAVAASQEEDRFVALPAYGWSAHQREGDGDRLVAFLEESGARGADGWASCPRPHDLFKLLHDSNRRRSIVAVLHPASKGARCDFTEHDPLHERLIGMYSALGCSERSVHDGNPFPLRPSGLPDGGEVSGVPLDAGEAPEGFVQRALALGWRVGFVGGGDGRHGHPGDSTKAGPEPFRYRDGLTGVWATELTRESIWDALWNRRTVASTGRRIVLRWEMNGHPMGFEVEAPANDGIMFQRLINVEVHGQARIVTVDIVRNKEVVHRERPGSHDATVSWTDEEPFESFALRPASGRAPFAFYYVRVLQDDGEMAWASPIWVTLGQ